MCKIPLNTYTDPRIATGMRQFIIFLEIRYSPPKMISKAQGVSLLSLDDPLPNGSLPVFAKQVSDTPSPLDDLTKKEMKEIISEAIACLPKKEQLVLSLYYYDELTLKEIAKVLDLTESRISQIHSKAIISLRTKLKGSELTFG